MANFANILLLALALPLVGAGAIWFVRGRGLTAVRQCALITSLLTLASASYLVWHFPGGAEPFAVSSLTWLRPDAGMDVRLSVGLDGLSLWLFALSALLVVTSILVSWESITDRAAAFYSLLLILATGMLGVFSARDIILFYIFFEFTLIPLFFLIGIWGSEDRRYAAIKFFLYTFAGSMLTFLGLLAIVLWNSQSTGVMTFSIPDLVTGLTTTPLPTHLQMWIFLALAAGFAIKVPLFPLHTWLPLAHVQAPAAGSVLLAGVLLKIGTYGFLRFSMPLLPEATTLAMPYFLWLSAVGIVYGALVALAQSDMKRLIAYSSVSHLGFCMLGIFALNRLGMQGGTLQMINHGLSTGGLFACVGMIYERYHTREISELGGLAQRMPILAFFMIIFTLSSIGAPGLNGFTGEFLLLLGMFQRAWTSSPAFWATQYLVISVLAVSGIVLGAWYMLLLVQKTMFGPLKEPHHGHGHKPVSDLNLREVCALVPLVVFIFWIGLYPKYFVDALAPSVNRVTEIVDQRYEQARQLDRPSAVAIRAGQDTVEELPAHD